MMILFLILPNNSNPNTSPFALNLFPLYTISVAYEMLTGHLYSLLADI